MNQHYHNPQTYSTRVLVMPTTISDGDGGVMIMWVCIGLDIYIVAQAKTEDEAVASFHRLLAVQMTIEHEHTSCARIGPAPEPIWGIIKDIPKQVREIKISLKVPKVAERPIIWEKA